MTDYRGLVNEGSTCYLNSLLQTLFMTPEFRANVYSYIHDPKKISETDSIPYQLQKLFVQLQRNDRSVYTKGLLRSFQWTEVDSFQQHDVQQFCRKLFEAIEVAFKGNKWIEHLYSGSTVSYLSCGLHPRENPELFMDLSLPIRNQFTKIYYNSVEECIKEYLRPEEIQGVQCEGCNGEKVKVNKGLRLESLPPILTLQLNRFQLSMETFQRQKVNSFVYFPEVLEMGRFLHKFEDIKEKGLPSDIKQKMKVAEKKKSARMTDWTGAGLFVEGKSIKPKRKNSDEIEAKVEKARFFDEEGKDQREQVTKDLSAEEQKAKNLQILKNLKAEQSSIDASMNKIQNKSKEPKQKEEEKAPQWNLDDDMLFGNAFGGPVDMSDFSKGSFEKGPTFEKADLTFEHEEESYDPQKQYPQNTYILYAVLVHAGGAYGGHYFAYIWNGTDWFKFNDQTVTKVDKKQMRKYGNPVQESTIGANAYLLFYRNINTLEELKKQIVIPEALNEKVKIDEAKTVHTEQKRKDRLHEVTRGLIIKVYTEQDKHETIVLRDRLSETIGDLKRQVKQVYKIDENDKNWRLRRYNKVEDTMHQVYGEDVDDTILEALGFRDTFTIAIERKKDDEEFEEYDPKKIIIKLNLWREDITSLTEQALKPVKLFTREEVKFEDFYQQVEKVCKVQNPIILKRSFSVGNPNIVYGLEKNKDKTLIDLRFFNCINLYVEPRDQNQVKLKWEEEFELESYRCAIKYNNPKLGEDKDQVLYFDTRKTLGDLKIKLAEIIQLPVDEFRIKKARQSVSQMTAYKKKLIDLRFIGQQFIYLQQGKSSKGQIIIRNGTVQIIEDKIEFILHDETQVQLNSNVTTVADLKNVLSEKFSIDSWMIRVREYKAFQFSEIFSDSESLQKIKEKSLVWEKLDTQDPKGLQIYFRVFDIMTMELGPLLYVFIDSSANYEELALILEEECQIQSDMILAWKAHSNYIEKSMFFESQWTQIRYIQKAIREEPLYLNRDGEILILKAAETSYHPKPTKKYTSSVVTGGQTSSNKKQPSLKITVVEERQIPEEQPTDKKLQQTELTQQKPQTPEQKAEENEEKKQ